MTTVECRDHNHHHHHHRHHHLFAQKELSIGEYVPLVTGGIGLMILMINRLSLESIVSDVQSRSDIITVIACSALLLNVLSDQDITPKEREAVPLMGYALKSPVVSSSFVERVVAGKGTAPAQLNSALVWLVANILRNFESISSVHLVSDYQVVAVGGVVSSKDNFLSDINESEAIILRKVVDQREQLYLPDLQVPYTLHCSMLCDCINVCLMHRYFLGRSSSPTCL
jgi:hypothetical protein